MINPQNKDEECFKWAFIAALHHEDIKHNSERINLLRPYEKQHNWKGLRSSNKKIDKFEKNNPGLTVNLLFSNKKSQKKKIYTVRRSGLNVKYKKQVNLLMIVDCEERHYTTIKNISRLSSKLNGKTQLTYHYCMSCRNGFRRGSTANKHYEHCSSNGHVRVKTPTEKEKW